MSVFVHIWSRNQNFWVCLLETIVICALAYIHFSIIWPYGLMSHNDSFGITCKAGILVRQGDRVNSLAWRRQCHGLGLLSSCWSWQFLPACLSLGIMAVCAVFNSSTSKWLKTHLRTVLDLLVAWSGPSPDHSNMNVWDESHKGVKAFYISGNYWRAGKRRQWLVFVKLLSRQRVLRSFLNTLGEKYFSGTI